MPLGPVPDFVGILRRALVNETTRNAAAEDFAHSFAHFNPLSHDHGSHMLRPSNFGACGLAFAAENLGLLDLERTDDNRAIMDTGTLLGAWFACLLKAGARAENTPFTVLCEWRVQYRGVPGNIDALIKWADGAHEPVEFKSTPGTGEIKPPDTRKLYQCLQGGTYALADEYGDVNAERFTIITFAYNAGNNKAGEPHEKFAQHTYETATFKPLVDAEIDRLSALLKIERTNDPAELAAVALPQPGAFCYSCRYSACTENKNKARFVL